jgi:hypothetical protein
MPRFLSNVRAVFCLLAASLFSVTLLRAAAEAQTCSHPDEPTFYNGYTVREVRIESPLAFQPAVKSQLARLRPELQLQPNGIFSPESYSQGVERISERLRASGAEDELLFKVVVVVGDFKNCDEGPARRLDVVYRVVSIGYSTYFSHTFEVKSEEVERPAVSGATNSTARRLLIQPFAGYNRTRQGYGGGKVLVRTPGGVFDSLRLVASGSSTSSDAELELIGARTLGKSLLNHLEYSLGYRYRDEPADGLRLREGKLAAQFFAASKPLGAHKVVLRYGLSLEGGNQQTGPLIAPASEHALANSGYGSLKTYFGATMRASQWALAGSYGLQAGTHGASADVDFVKHLADVSFTARLLPGGAAATTGATPRGEFNKPFDIEARFTAGKIQRLGSIPVVERFFGGNEAQDFITGDDWRIRSAPFIRSIPQNRLNAAGVLGPIGGTGFYSFNLTLARPVWGYPLVPRELRDDPEFDRQLQSQMKSARKTLALWHKTKLPAFRELLGNLDTLIANLNGLNSQLDSLSQNAQGDLSDQLDDAKDSVGFASFTLGEILKRANATDPQSIGEGFNEGDLVIVLKNKIPGEVSESVNAVIETLRQNGAQQQATQLSSARDALQELQKKLLAAFQAIDNTAAERQADEDMAAVNPVLKAFLHELNLVSVSPVFIFDAARLWPDRNGTRFGIGGGVRVTLVNFNVTVGYAVNPNPRPREGHGALVFSMDITELFR